MNNNQNNWRSTLGIITLVGSGVLAALGEVIVHRYFWEVKYVSWPVHAAFEIVGALLGLAIAALVWSIWRHDANERSAHCLLIAAAFGGMGALDIIHALVAPGNLFVWLHTLAMFVGAVFFAAVWLPASVFKMKAPTLPAVATAGAAALGIFFVIYPELAPIVSAKGQMTPLALNINLAAGLLFLAAAAHFMNEHLESGRVEEILLANLCMLSAIAAMFFYVSQLWNADWWFWHVIRFWGYAVTLAMLVITKEEVRENGSAGANM